MALQAADNVRMQVLLIEALTALGDLDAMVEQMEDAQDLYRRALDLAEALKQKELLQGEDAALITNLKAKLESL